MHPAKSEVGWSAFASDHLEDFPHRPEDQFSAEVVFVSILLLETLSPQIMCRWFPRLNFTAVLIAFAKNLKRFFQVYYDMFTFTPMEGAEGKARVCQGDFCCLAEWQQVSS